MESSAIFFFFFSSRRRHTRSLRDWSSDVCSSDLVLGNLAGSWAAYGLGYLGRIDLLEKHGRKLHVKPSHLRWADGWFTRYGSATVFFTRMLPIIRTFISLPAGVARMPFWRFSALTLAGCVPWVLALALIGKSAGDNWTDWKDNLHYADYAVLAL